MKLPRIREPGHILVVHNPPPTPEMEEFAVKQEFKKEVDINTIISNMQKGIQPPPWMTSNTPRFGDFTDMPTTFQEAFELTERANQAFLSLPIEMRKELDHDPRNLDFADKAMYERYGLLKAPADAASGTPEPKRADASTSEARQSSKEPKAPKTPQTPPTEE